MLSWPPSLLLTGLISFSGVIKRCYHREIRKLIFPGFGYCHWICYEQVWEERRKSEFQPRSGYVMNPA